jgi:diguanylate cyclase (GGDEF)-like protein
VAPDHASPKAQVRAQSTWRDLLERLRVRQISAARRILYVDTDVQHARDLRRTASAHGATVDWASDAIEAFSRCVEFAYDVVVLSTSEGLADKLLDPVRTLQASAAVILLKDSSRLLTLVPPDDVGVAGILTKPWEERQLLALLERSFALADTRLEWSSAVRTSPVSVRVLFVGSEQHEAQVAKHLKQTPDGAAVAIHGVRSLADATSALESMPIDAVITALTLPDARGLDTVAHFSEGPKAKPLIVLAERRDPPLVVQVLRHGAHDFLTYGALDRLNEALANALDRHRATERVAHLAHHDSLTGLPNRVLFEQRLQASISRASRKREQLAVLYIDLDDFKPINDRYGHDAGDRVLQTVANRILATVRDYDTPARLGGDEFAIVLNSLEHAHEAATVAGRVHAALSQPVDIGETSVPLGCSIGIAVLPDAGTTAQTLLSEADRAMYRVKRTGRNGVATKRPKLRLIRGAGN